MSTLATWVAMWMRLGTRGARNALCTCVFVRCTPFLMCCRRRFLRLTVGARVSKAWPGTGKVYCGELTAVAVDATGTPTRLSVRYDDGDEVEHCCEDDSWDLEDWALMQRLLHSALASEVQDSPLTCLLQLALVVGRWRFSLQFTFSCLLGHMGHLHVQGVNLCLSGEDKHFGFFLCFVCLGALCKVTYLLILAWHKRVAWAA